MRYHKVPDETIKRLPLYVRHLQLILKDGKSSIRSNEFKDQLDIRPAQVRRDLAYFGSFGKPGVGYDAQKLLLRLLDILKLKNVNKTVLVGVGNLGSALLSYPGFSRFSIEIVAAFDNNCQRIGLTKNGIRVEDITELSTLEERQIKLAILAVPAAAAQEIAERLIKAGIIGILNFSPCHLSVPKRVKVVSVDIAMYLSYLPYYLPEQ